MSELAPTPWQHSIFNHLKPCLQQKTLSSLPAYASGSVDMMSSVVHLIYMQQGHTVTWLSMSISGSTGSTSASPVKESSSYLNMIQKADPNAHREKYCFLDQRRCDNDPIEQPVSPKHTADGAAAAAFKAAVGTHNGLASTACSTWEVNSRQFQAWDQTATKGHSAFWNHFTQWQHSMHVRAV